MRVLFLAPSDKELDEAVRFYDDQLDGLGRQFYREIMVSIAFITRYPKSWRKVGEHTRKCTLRRFPYLLLYVVEDSCIVITAIAHQHRKPNYYADRIR